MMRPLYFLWSARTLVAIMTMMMEAKCITDIELVVNCSSTTYPDVSCSTPPNTASLDLSHNNVKTISESMFSTLQKLQKLYLQFNQISFVNPLAFQNNPVLEYLDISHNDLPEISALPLTHLPALTYLDISNNAYEVIQLAPSFGSLKHLQRLKLGNSHAVSIQKNPVKVTEELDIKEVHLVAGKIKEYEPGSLEALKNMDLVTLEAENCQEFDKMYLMLSDICNSTKALKLMKLDLRQTSVALFINDTILKSNIKQLILQDLSVSGAYCSVIQYALKSNLEEVIIEGLHAEGICNIALGTFERCHLKKLSVKDIDNEAFLIFEPQPTLNKFMECLTGLSAIHIGESFFPCPMSENLKHLTTLNVSHNYLDDKNMFPHCKMPFPALQSLAIDYNHFEHLVIFGNKISHMKDLANLTASHNKIHLEPQPGTVAWPKSLKRMDLGWNQLSDEVFLYLPETLEMLDLSHNYIDTVTNIQGMKNLADLRLSGNRIKSLNGLRLPPSVLRLYVDLNNITTLSTATVSSFSVTALDFSGNPLHCDCDTEPLIRYCRAMSETKVLGWPSGYRCQTPESLRGETLQQISLPWPSCNRAAFACIIICCCLSLSALCYILYLKLRKRSAYSTLSALRNRNRNQGHT
ncbi:toll-like receptor 2 [Sardina pilchardus]|uniref:toll-like receptor 2 n=1 Tax=Sardina pilchardus TaxID=27697 RepID=UPI002E1643FF